MSANYSKTFKNHRPSIIKDDDSIYFAKNRITLFLCFCQEMNSNKNIEKNNGTAINQYNDQYYDF